MNVTVRLEFDGKWWEVRVPPTGTEHFTILDRLKHVLNHLRPERPSMSMALATLGRLAAQHPEAVTIGTVQPTITHLPDPGKRPKRDPNAKVVFGDNTDEVPEESPQPTWSWKKATEGVTPLAP